MPRALKHTHWSVYTRGFKYNIDSSCINSLSSKGNAYRVEVWEALIAADLLLRHKSSDIWAGINKLPSLLILFYYFINAELP